jgi:hypothetical protein
MRASAGIVLVRGVAALTFIVAAFAAIPAGQARASATELARGGGATPSGVLAGTGVLDDVVATSARNAWAVGHFGPLSHPKTLIEHWNGKAWQRVRVTPAIGWLNGVAATSAGDVWAVGFSRSATLILHFNGTSWSRMPSPPSSGGLLADVTAVSPSDAWAVGITGGAGNLMMHWNGKAWRRVHVASRALMVGVSALSAKNVWAVGGLRGTVTLHWNGTAWRHVKSPSPAVGATLQSVAAISARDVWAVGESPHGTLILRWNGRRWQKVSSPAIANGAGLLGVSGTSAHNVWAAGTSGGLVVTTSSPAISPRLVRNAGGAMSIAAATAPAAQTVEPVILHWNGKSWQRVRIQAPASGGQLIGDFALSAHTALAVGCTKNFGNRNAKPLVVRLRGNTG